MTPIWVLRMADGSTWRTKADPTAGWAYLEAWEAGGGMSVRINVRQIQYFWREDHADL